MVAINNTTKQKINLTQTKKIVEQFLQVHKKNNWEVSVAIVGDQKMKRLNWLYRQSNKTTDVLSFRGGEFMGRYLGEVIINVNYLKRPAQYHSIFSKKPSFNYLFYFILIHGLLHLIGYDDDTEQDRQKMIIRGQKFLAKYY